MSPAHKQPALSSELGACSSTPGANQMLCQDICKTTAHSTRSDTALEPTEEGYFLESLVSWGWSARCSPPPSPLPAQGPGTDQPAIIDSGETKEKSWKRKRKKTRQTGKEAESAVLEKKIVDSEQLRL